MQEKLLILRRRHGFTQQQMSEKLGMSVTSYAKKERGEVEFTADEMFLVKDIFNKSLEEIFLPRSHRIGDIRKELI